ncbi:MAG: ATP-dependent DNA helicase RecG [Omnitrophica WOR_2 bacterium GWA2_53_43]|nr:MAG: ATP-dependent DNA helicase RecG [Omnitrophica WOR_2 bacterium GWA2_53_43]
MRSLSDISIQFVKGVGPARKKIFQRLGIESVEDLLYFFPRRYEDRRDLVPISRLKVGEFQTVTGKILGSASRRSWYTKKHVLEVVLEDDGGHLVCTWFNQPYLMNYFKEGRHAVCYGKVDMYKDRLQMISPEWEIIEEKEDAQLNLGRIVPVYPLTRGVTQRFLRKTIHACLERYQNQLIDELPVPLRNKYKLYNIKRGIRQAHFPDSFPDQENAMKRISFEEFYFFQIAVLARRLSITRKPGFAHTMADAEVLKFIDGFPFALTRAQTRVIGEIRQDMAKDTPMLRLLQGDVGSGKTLVAIFGCVTAARNGFQSCVMAPTEILARQHYENISRMIEQGHLADLRAALLTGAVTGKEKEKLCARIRSGEVDLVIGTHALMGGEAAFRNLSFIVVDEQHKFGVRQRALLAEKGHNPDILIMTATPIPRTLCITLYGDMDLSVLDELPPGRGEVKTRLYPEDRAEEVYALAREQLKKGRQVYVVYPIIEESEKLDLKAARTMFNHFKKETFKDFRVGLVHGQLKAKEGQEIMDQFKNGKIDLLVATTVLEVGIDVPAAGVMVIEHAERFGLAQLHQLRGRIGRGKEDGLCLLIGEAETDDSQQRLKAFVSTTDGFKIAQRDLEIRGPGRYFGRHQHGLNELKVANPFTQLDILELARQEATALTGADSKLEKEQNRRVGEIIRRRYPSYLTDVAAG